jgi:putative transcriptional regulator
MRYVTLLLLALVLASAAFAQEASTPSLKGKFLVADPSMPDPRFASTVIYMIAHSADGAVGVVVNRPGARRPLADVMRAFGLAPREDLDAEIDLHWGGPVDGNHVLLLHSEEYKAPSTVALAPGVALSMPKDALGDIAAGRGPRQHLLAVGYAGWAPGQLERELESKSWAVIGSGAGLLFDADAAGKWRRAWALRTQEL